MENISIQVKPEQLISAIKQLSFSQRKQVEQVLWAEEMDKIVTKLRTNAKKNGITAKEIKEYCEEARQKTYEKRCNR